MVNNVKIMGIVNLTPDSFYSGSRAPQADIALPRIEKMFEDGADVVDLGACSTRPGSAQPSLEEEWARFEPTLRQMGAKLPDAKMSADASGSSAPIMPCISIDTYRAEIVQRVYDTIGPFIVNDISAGELDPKMLETVGRLGLPYIAMHMRGTPGTMQQLTDYPNDDVTAAVIDYFKKFAAKADENGIREWILDPGFGFSKTLEQNYELLSRLDEVVKAFPVETLVGVSRKSMIYKKLGITPEEAMPATQVVQFAALERGATWLRSHDVTAAIHTATIYSAMNYSSTI